MVNVLPRICPAYREATACSCGIAAGMFMHGTEIKVPAYSWLAVGVSTLESHRAACLWGPQILCFIISLGYAGNVPVEAS